MADSFSETAPPPLEVVYFTDPLCSWCWAFEPQRRRLQYEYGMQLTWRYRMGGLIADWNAYHDPVNDVHRPAQMGPLWLHVGGQTGMPFEPRLWTDAPPESSYPACIACKAAERQGPEFLEHYLRRLREAVMLQCRNIARPEVLVAAAWEAAAEMESPPDITEFVEDLNRPAVRETFREDLKEAGYRGAARFPTLILQQGAKNAVLVGYRPYAALRSLIEKMAPDLAPTRGTPAPAEYVRFWRRITAREVAEAVERDPTEIARELDELAAAPDSPITADGALYCLR